jgi:hypothetical protein
MDSVFGVVLFVSKRRTDDYEHDYAYDYGLRGHHLCRP